MNKDKTVFLYQDMAIYLHLLESNKLEGNIQMTVFSPVGVIVLTGSANYAVLPFRIFPKIYISRSSEMLIPFDQINSILVIYGMKINKNARSNFMQTYT